MGSKAKIIIPLVALAAVGVATGGFGLAAGAVGGTTGLAGATAVTTATGVLAGSGTAAGTLAATGGGLLAAPGAASTGLFSSLSSSFSAMSGFEQAGLGLKALSAVGGITSAGINANGQAAALAAQENDLKISQAGDRLELANAEVDSQKRLGRTYAAIANFGGNRAPLTDAANAEAGSEMDILSSRRNLSEQGAASTAGMFALKRRRAAMSGAGSQIGALLDFGGSALDTLEKRRRIG